MKSAKTFFTKPHISQQKHPRLAVTIGDPAGIGPEVVLKALADPEVTANCEIVVVGSLALLQQTYQQLLKQRPEIADSLVDPEQLTILDVQLGDVEQQVKIGTRNAASGATSFAYMEAAIARTLAGEFDAIVTAPIAKSAWNAAGYNYPGQTELLAEKSKSRRVGMLFVARSPYTGWVLRTLLATTHIPLSKVNLTLTLPLLTTKLDLLIDCLQKDFGIEKPRIAIAGLNPHSGEQGQLGTEEQDWLIPWVEQQRQQRPQVELDGPLSPDTMWVKPGQAWFGNSYHSSVVGAGLAHNSNLQPITSIQNPPVQQSAIPNVADGFLALYHDQGLIPVKLMAFDRAVNTSIGLPFVRTSPDHGTAFDIAGLGIADATSMKAALQLAAELVCQRKNL